VRFASNLLPVALVTGSRKCERVGKASLGKGGGRGGVREEGGEEGSRRGRGWPLGCYQVVNAT